MLYQPETLALDVADQEIVRTAAPRCRDRFVTAARMKTAADEYHQIQDEVLGGWA